MAPSPSDLMKPNSTRPSARRRELIYPIEFPSTSMALLIHQSSTAASTGELGQDLFAAGELH